MNIDTDTLPDNTAMLIIRQGKLLYSIGTDVDFSDDISTSISFNRMDKMLERAKYNTQVQILEKNPEDVNLIA